MHHLHCLKVHPMLECPALQNTILTTLTIPGQFIQISMISRGNWSVWMYGKNIMDAQMDIQVYEHTDRFMIIQQINHPSIHLPNKPKWPMATPNM